jgi:hypothetical protein
VKKINISDINISILNINHKDYISLTDIASYKNKSRSDDVIKNWMRNKNTLVFLGLWEKINNPNFKPVEFDGFKTQAGLNSFVIGTKTWIKGVNAIGLISRQGRYGGTYAHKDIAFEFASWISAEFKLYLIKEFQRLKEKENRVSNLDWNAKRMLTKINYRIHTDAISKHIVPKLLNKNEYQRVYASEADILNMALFGITAKQWRNINHNKKGNVRDYANLTQLICLANLESLNAEFIRQGLIQSKRLKRLNKIAVIQMSSLLKNTIVFANQGAR